MAKKTVAPMVDKVSRLYEQGADDVRIETYLYHWWRWVRSGVDGVSLFGFGLDAFKYISTDHRGNRSRLAVFAFRYAPMITRSVVRYV